MTLLEKQQLRKLIQKLPAKNLDRVVEIIELKNPSGNYSCEEMNIDLDGLVIQVQKLIASLLEFESIIIYHPDSLFLILWSICRTISRYGDCISTSKLSKQQSIHEDR